MRAIMPIMLSLVALSSPSPQTIEDRTLGLSYNDDRTRVIATFPSDPPLKNLQYAKFGRWQLLTHENGGAILMILHPGYGYVGIQLDLDSMLTLKQSLEKLSATQLH